MSSSFTLACHFLIISVFLKSCGALENGLALTPPMGWMHWQRFRCVTDCENYPDDCVREELFYRMADRLVDDGYLDAGYDYLIIDDCWLAKDRDVDGKLQADAERFPNGIKAIADYVHSKGLKFGLYEDYGTFTCAGYPGVIDNLKLDAETFAEWDVDYVKLDACYSESEGRIEGYRAFGRYLNETGRPMVYSCSFPAYEESFGIESNYTAAIEICNLWRNYGDIDDSWQAVVAIAEWFADNQDRLAPNAGPGHWNDPDMLIIGNYGLSYEQSLAQMATWSVMAAPLIMSVDLATIRPEMRAILLNRDAIAINQDRLGVQGKLKQSSNGISTWTKPIEPCYYDDDEGIRVCSYGIAVVSERTDGYPVKVAVKLSELLDEPQNSSSYHVKDVFGSGLEATPEIVEASATLIVRVKPSGGVLIKLTAL